MIRKYLLDLDVVIALTEPEHEHHRKAHDWFNTIGNDCWGISPLTEVEFLRVAANPTAHPAPHALEHAKAIIQTWKGQPGYRLWPIEESWVTLTVPFASRIFGHQQITDAYLLGLAIKEDGVLVTFDKGIRYMAGAEFNRNVLILESSKS
jgi:hypothetical protein